MSEQSTRESQEEPREERLAPLLAACASGHRHLCPRQVLGVRIGVAGAAALGLEAPRTDKRLFLISETDGCFVSGLVAATGSRVERRTLRVEDSGRVAATFVDVDDERAVRVAPRCDVRTRALAYAPGETRRWFAMRAAYQVMPDEELLVLESVRLLRPIGEIISRPGLRATCESCHEEILNEREVRRDGRLLCRVCAGESYYRTGG